MSVASASASGPVAASRTAPRIHARFAKSKTCVLAESVAHVRFAVQYPTASGAPRPVGARARPQASRWRRPSACFGLQQQWSGVVARQF